MSKIIPVLSLITIVIGMVAFVFVKKWYVENQIDQCISDILIKEEIASIEIFTKDRGKKPILKGVLNQTQKDKLFLELYQHCKIDEIQDFLTITNPVNLIHSSLNFKIDHVNNVVNISGVANNQQKIDNVLSSFKTAIGNNIPPSEIPWTLIPDISINNQSDEVDFSITITLLFSAINNIKLTDISIANNQLLIRGLVRDKIRKNETINKIEQLFSDEYTIVDELELVLKHKLNLPVFQLENFPPPIVENPPSQN